MDLRRSLVTKKIIGSKSKQASRNTSRNNSNQGTDDELEDDDYESIVSADSGDFVLEGSTELPWETQLQDTIERLLERKGSSQSSREHDLLILIMMLSRRVVASNICDRASELFTAICRILRAAKVETEFVLCTKAMALIRLTVPDDYKLHECGKSFLIRTINDSEFPVAKAAALTSLGMSTLLLQDVVEIRSWLDFMIELIENNGITVAAQDDALVLSAAIEMLALTLSGLRGDDPLNDLEAAASCLSEQLESPDYQVRSAAGEGLALCFEMSFEARDDSDDETLPLPASQIHQLIKALSELATSSSKRQSKSSRREQHAVFREVLATVSNPSSHASPTEIIKFGTSRQSLYVTTWLQFIRLAQFRRLLGSGIQVHLQRNAIVRQMLHYDGGSVVDFEQDGGSAAAISDVSKEMRHSINSEVRKQRHKERADERKEKSAMHSSFVAEDD